MICSCVPFARKIPVRKRREQRLLAKDNKRRLNRFVNSPAPNASKNAGYKTIVCRQRF